LIRSILALIAPGPCRVCGDDLPAVALACVCPLCWSSLPLHVGRACARCDLPLADAARAAPLHECPGRGRSGLERVVAPFVYEDAAVTLHRLLKFDGADRLAAPLGRAMALAWRLRGPFDPEMCVPVPADRLRLPPRRLAAGRLARAVAARLGRPRDRRALWKTRTTRPQTGRDRGARSRALRGLFRADPARVRGRSVLVVDDVATTGATLREAARALAAAGARRTGALVLARTPSPGYRLELSAAAGRPEGRKG